MLQSLIDGRSQPHSIDAERSVLGAMILDAADSAMYALETLQADDFYSFAHKEIFEVLRGLHAGGSPIDLVTVMSELIRRGTNESVGGAAYLSDLMRFVPATANVRAYIQIVEDKSTLRKLIQASTKIMRESYAASREVPEILEDAEKAIYNIAMKKGEDAFESLSSALVKAYSTIEMLYQNKGSISGVPTGFRDLDQMTTGLHAGELVLIAARPAMGKTSLAMNIAQFAAMHARKTVAAFSLEMPAEQLASRMLCSEALVDMQAVRHGLLSDDDWEKLAMSMGPLAMSKLFIDDTSGITVNQVRSRCRRLQMEHGLDMIVIDYLQLMSGSGKNSSNRQQEVSEISRSLKGLAQELGVPLIALSQLSRAPQGRSDHRPMLSDLRDSGAIEQDADIVMFIYRDEYYNKDTTAEPGVAEVIISKQRNGPLGTVRLAWNGQHTRFSDLPEDYVPPVGSGGE